MHPRILDVVENDLCIACGACLPACPVKAIVPDYSDTRGAHEVAIANQDACPDCSAPCEAVCPSIAVDYASLMGATDGVPREGPIEKAVLAHIPIHRDNGVSSSGGVVRAFIEWYLQTERPVICLVRSPAGGYEPALLSQPSDIKRVPGSIYHGVSFATAITLLKKVREPCLLVSTPCQLEGIENFVQKIAPELRSKIALKLGLICGWMYTDHALKAFTSYKGIGTEIVDAQYRGEDQVGLLKLTTERGTFRYDRRLFATTSELYDYRASFTSAMNRLRCRTCQNHVNVLADVAVGDAWLERSPGVKRSIVVLRTREGVRAFNQLCTTADVIFERAHDTDLVESQSANLVYGSDARQLAAYLADQGTHVPAFVFDPQNDGDAAELTDSNARRFRRELRDRKIIRAGRYARHRRRYVWNQVKQWIRRKLHALMRHVGKRWPITPLVIAVSGK